MKKIRTFLFLIAFGFSSAGVYASEVDTLVQCTQSFRFGGFTHSIPSTSSFFDICLRSTRGTDVVESRIDQTKNYLPIQYALKFVDGSSVSMRLALVDAKKCKDSSVVVLRNVGQGMYSGRTCVYLKSPKDSAVELTATNKVPSGLKAGFISTFRFQIHSSYCSNFTRNVCSPREYLRIGFRFEEDSLE